MPRWHQLGTAEIVVTNQRLIATGSGQTESLWYAEIGPFSSCPAEEARPACSSSRRTGRCSGSRRPGAPLLYVFVHYLVDGQAPGVPMPAGLLERARQQGGSAR